MGLASERAKRPSDFKKVKEEKDMPAYRADCPFCPGNEGELKEERYRLGDEKHWRTRAVYNKFPALSDKVKEERKTSGPHKWINGFGIHEVIVENPAHNKTIANNKSIQMQMEDVQFAKANIQDARSLFLSQVQAGLGYALNDAVLSTDSTSNKRKDLGVFSGYKNDNLFNVSLNESVYNGGANIANLKEAKLQLNVQEETLRAARLDVEFETKRLFYGLLLAYETKRIANDLVDQAQAHYEEVNARFGQGTASRFDVLQSKVQVSRLIPQLVNAENAIELIIAEFKKLLSLDNEGRYGDQGRACIFASGYKRGRIFKRGLQQ